MSEPKCLWPEETPDLNRSTPAEIEADERQTERQAPDNESPGLPAAADP